MHVCIGMNLVFSSTPHIFKFFFQKLKYFIKLKTTMMQLEFVGQT